MAIDWTGLAADVGSIRAEGERGGTTVAQYAIERILGEANLRAAVELVLASGPGSELAMSVLSLICSWTAAEIVYAEYKRSTGDRASRAVWLIKSIAHPHSKNWISEFLADDNVSGWGIDLLDQLVWLDRIDSEEAGKLLTLAEHNKRERVRQKAAFVREQLVSHARQHTRS